MSLARTLLNGVTESVNTTGYTFNCTTTESCYVDAACESLLSDIYAVDKAYCVADIMGEVKVLTESANGEAILEGMISSGIEKLKEAFKKFWAKIKAWFAQVKKFLKSLFLQGKDFVKEFEKELTHKETKGFTYTGFKYTMEAGEAACGKVMDVVNREVNVCAGGIKKGASVRSQEEIKDRVAELGVKVATDKMDSATEFAEMIISKRINIGGATNSSELTEALEKAFRNGDDTVGEIDDFGANGVDEMLELVGGLDNKIKGIERDEDAFEKDVNNIIKSLDDIKKADNEPAYKLAQKFSSYATQLLTIGKIPTTVKAAVYKEAAGKYRSVLGSFYRWKPAKESFDATTESVSLLDAAMELI